MEEFSIIDQFFKPLTNNLKQAQNLEDDVALIADNLVVSKDVMVQNIHFRIEDGGYNIAQRLLRSNLSDIASSGTKPLYYLLAFSKNSLVDKKFILDFTTALNEINQEFKIALIGGDTVKSGTELFFSITIFGQKKDDILLRKNAKNNDLIFVSGYVGDAFLGRLISENKIKSSSKKTKEYLQNRYFKPTPRINLGLALTKNKLSNCATDISDGLLADINQIAKTSKVKAKIFLDEITISNQATEILKYNSNITKLDLISAGDDYELIFTAKKDDEKAIAKLAKKLEIPLSLIGYFEKNSDKESSNIELISNNRIININKFGYEH